MTDVLFDPIDVIAEEPSNTKRLRYCFEADVQLIAIRRACDCDECYMGVEEDEEIPVWSIIDRQRGQYFPIATCEDADQAQKIVDALNAMIE